MMRFKIRGGVLALAIGLAGCELAVQNPNNPETDRVLRTPADVENLLGTQYLRWHTAMYGALGNVGGMAGVQSHEDVSSLRSEEHTSELHSPCNRVCRPLRARK